MGAAVEPASLAQIVDTLAHARPDAPFLIDPASELTSYREFQRLAGTAAAALRRYGVRKGDRVLTLCGNQLTFFAAAFGAWRLGAILVPLAHEQRGMSLGQMLRNADPAVVLVDDAGQAALDSVQPSDCVSASAIHRIDALLVGPTSEERLSRYDDDEPALIMYSSGTTGVSKGCVLSHGYMVLAGRDFCRAVDMRPDDLIYSSGPFSHLNAWWAFAGAIHGGVQLAFDTRFSASRFWMHAEAVQATLFDYVGVMIAIMLRREETPNSRCRLRAGVGGAARPDEMKSFLDRFGIPLLECYGLTECCLPTYQRESEMKIGSIGRRAEVVDARIVDTHGVDVPIGERGELWLRAKDRRAMFSGYWRRDDLTAAAFSDDWFRTGDICSEDQAGYLYYIDRKRHFIRRRGENISAFEVEGIVFNHPAVANCAAVGVPADIGEEDILLAVQAKQGQEVDPSALLEWCRERMASFMVPRYVRVIEQLPLTPSERVEKQKLRDQGVTLGTYDAHSDLDAKAHHSTTERKRLIPALGMRQVGQPEALFVADPGAPKQGEVRVAVELVPISIAEVRALRGDRFRHFGQKVDPSDPFVFGFTGVGRVVESRSTKVPNGVRVVLSGLASCGACRFCRVGLENHCERLKLAGIDVGSPGFARAYVCIPERRAFQIPESIALEKACVVSEVATAIHCLRRGRVRGRDSVGVVGTGRHGRQIVRVAKRWGHYVVAIDPSPIARRLALQAGADQAIDVTGLDFAALARLRLDVVVHANSFEESLATCCDVAARKGRIVLLGTPAGLDVMIPGFSHRVVSAERELIGSDSKNPESFTAAVGLIDNSDEDWDIRRPRRMKLEDAADAMLQAAERWPPEDDLFVDFGSADPGLSSIGNAT